MKFKEIKAQMEERGLRVDLKLLDLMLLEAEKKAQENPDRKNKLKASKLRKIKERSIRDAGLLYFKFFIDEGYPRMMTGDYNIQSIDREHRKVVIPEEGCKFIHFDMKSLQFKIAVALAGATKLKQMMENGSDYYVKIAGVVGSNDRKLGKELVLGFLFGQEARGLSQKLDISEEQAQIYINKFGVEFKELINWKKKVISKARDEGGITIANWHLDLPNLYSDNEYERAKAERQAVNFTCVANEVYLMKKIAEKVSETYPDVRWKILLHDAFVVETGYEINTELFSSVVKQNFNGVDLTAEVKVLNCWK